MRGGGGVRGKWKMESGKWKMEDMRGMRGMRGERGGGEREVGPAT